MIDLITSDQEFLGYLLLIFRGVKALVIFIMNHLEKHESLTAEYKAQIKARDETIERLHKYMEYLSK